MKKFAIAEPDQRTMKFCVDPCKDFLVMGNKRGTIFVWDLKSLKINPGNPPLEIQCGKGNDPQKVRVTHVAVSPLINNTRILLVAVQEGTIHTYELKK